MGYRSNKSQFAEMSTSSQITRCTLFYLKFLLLLILVEFVVAETGSQECPEACNLCEESGLCLALFYRYHFDIKTKKCNEFVYGGCGGNANNFKTMEECIKFGARCLEKCPPPSQKPRE